VDVSLRIFCTENLPSLIGFAGGIDTGQVFEGIRRAPIPTSEAFFGQSPKNVDSQIGTNGDLFASLSNVLAHIRAIAGPDRIQIGKIGNHVCVRHRSLKTAPIEWQPVLQSVMPVLNEVVEWWQLVN